MPIGDLAMHLQNTIRLREVQRRERAAAEAREE
jgi:hypothetical protein